jgi:hypothetical protein
MVAFCYTSIAARAAKGESRLRLREARDNRAPRLSIVSSPVGGGRSFDEHPTHPRVLEEHVGALWR